MPGKTTTTVSTRMMSPLQQQQHQGSSYLYSKMSALPYLVGEVVYVNGEGDWRGKICYIGEVHFAKGEWAGVALDHPLGNHDGSVRGHRYFQCGSDNGIFVRLRRLSRQSVVPESLDPGRIGLHRLQERFWREASPSSSSYSSGRMSSSRESSPLRTTTVVTPKKISFESNNYRSVVSGVKPNEILLRKSSDGLLLGERVIVASSVGETKTGVLRYLGPVAFADGEWAGIQLFHPLGKNDGTVRGRQYFVCEHPYGLFVPRGKVESSPANKTIARRMGTRENLKETLLVARGIRAGSYEDYY